MPVDSGPVTNMVGHSDRFNQWMFIERLRVVALMDNQMNAYAYLTVKGKALAKEMHFRFPRAARGKAYG